MSNNNESNTNNNFLSQPISQRGTNVGGQPLLQPTASSRMHKGSTSTSGTAVNPSFVGSNGLISVLPQKEMNKNDRNDGLGDRNNKSYSSCILWEWSIDLNLVPTLPVYYVLEPTSMTLPDLPVPVVQERISGFLRLYSISYSYHADTVRLDCCTSTMLKFAIQFWFVPGQDGRSLTLELQRREGSVIEMQGIRRKMFQVITTGNQPTQPSIVSHPPPLPDAIMAEVDLYYNHEQGRADAMRICLQLLESANLDQFKLGLESLRILTDPSVVSFQDAVFISRELLIQDTSDVGHRLQAALTKCFGESAVIDAYSTGTYKENIHNLGLLILGNALELVLEDVGHAASGASASTIDLATPFWTVVKEDLLNNMEQAVYKPNEGAMSAKCFRLLCTLQNQVHAPLPVSTSMRPTCLRTCLAEAHKYGRHCHLSLERECQRLLASLSF